MNFYGFDRRRNGWICCRQSNRNRRDILVDLSHPSLLYQILEARLFNCLRTNQISFSNPVIRDEMIPSLSSPHLITKNETSESLNVNDYEKATL